MMRSRTSLIWSVIAIVVICVAIECVALSVRVDDLEVAASDKHEKKHEAGKAKEHESEEKESHGSKGEKGYESKGGYVWTISKNDLFGFFF